MKGSRMKHSIPIKLCELAEKDHRRSKRQYAHTYHHPRTICVCKAFWDLPKELRAGVLAHEIGHLLFDLLGAPDPKDHTERAADHAIWQQFGIAIDYVDDHRHGKRLQYIIPSWMFVFDKTFQLDTKRGILTFHL